MDGSGYVVNTEQLGYGDSLISRHWILRFRVFGEIEKFRKNARVPPFGDSSRLNGST